MLHGIDAVVAQVGVLDVERSDRRALLRHRAVVRIVRVRGVLYGADDGRRGPGGERDRVEVPRINVVVNELVRLFWIRGRVVDVDAEVGRRQRKLVVAVDVS